MNFNERLQKLNSEYADAQVFHDNQEINRICELTLDLCEEMQMIPEIKWIPCSERLPDKQDFYMVTVKFEDGRRRVMSDIPFIIPQDDYDELGFWDIGRSNAQVTAWMSMVEVYKENIDQ